MQVPADLVIDHSVEAEMVRSEKALQANMELEFRQTKKDLLSSDGAQVLLTTCFLFLLALGLSTR